MDLNRNNALMCNSLNNYFPEQCKHCEETYYTDTQMRHCRHVNCVSVIKKTCWVVYQTYIIRYGASNWLLCLPTDTKHYVAVYCFANYSTGWNRHWCSAPLSFRLPLIAFRVLPTVNYSCILQGYFTGVGYRYILVLVKQPAMIRINWWYIHSSKNTSLVK